MGKTVGASCTTAIQSFERIPCEASNGASVLTQECGLPSKWQPTTRVQPPANLFPPRISLLLQPKMTVPPARDDITIPACQSYRFVWVQRIRVCVASNGETSETESRRWACSAGNSQGPSPTHANTCLTIAAAGLLSPHSPKELPRPQHGGIVSVHGSLDWRTP